MSQRIGIIGSTSSSGAPTWRDDELQAFERDFLLGGVIQGIGTALAVVQRAAGANMSVDVGIGRALYSITNTNLAPSKTYKVYHDSDAVVNVPISTADATNPRIDIIVMKCDVSQNPDSASGNIPSITVVAGTPAGSPSAPATPANSIKLAQIAVAAGAASIVTGNITDSRVFVTVNTVNLLDLARETKITAIHGNEHEHATATGSSNAYAITVTTNKTAYQAGQRFSFIANFSNTGSATLNVNGWGAKTLKKLQGSTNIVSGDITNGAIVLVEYDGTNMQMLIPLATTITQDDDIVAATVLATAADRVSAVSDTPFATKYSAPGNFLANSGDRWVLKAKGCSLTVANATTLTVKLEWGTTVIASFAPTPAASVGGKWTMDAEVICKTSGASGVLYVEASFFFEKGSSGAYNATLYQWDAITGANQLTGFDLTVAKDITITAAWNNTSQILELEDFFVEKKANLA